MQNRGPILTLVAVVALGLVLFVVNLSAAPGTPAAAPAAAPASSASPAPAAQATPFPAKAKYTGNATKADGTPVPIAITVDGGKVKAYLCDGKSIEAWYQGSQQNGKLVDVKGKGQNKLEGQLDGETIKGEVTVLVGSDVVKWPYEAAVAKKADSGLYRASGANGTTGWIVRDDGSQTGITQPAGGGAPAPAPPLDLANIQASLQENGGAPVEGDTNVVSG
jgi:uncharacterized protein (DUF2147 family)